MYGEKHYYDTCIWCGRELNIGSPFKSTSPFCGEKCKCEYEYEHGGRQKAEAKAAAEALAAAMRERESEARREREAKEALSSWKSAEQEDEDYDPRLSWKGYEWVERIIKESSFADGCYWWTLDGKDWVELLLHKPQFSEKCEWRKLKGEDWVELLSQGPEFADKCNWGQLNSQELRLILEAQPNLIDKCAIDVLSAGSWARLLQVQPLLIKKCKKIDDIDGDHWADLLSKRPELFDKCSDLEKLTAANWATVLANQPQLVERCKKVLGVDGWFLLLSGSPQFAEQCNKWDQFASHHLLDLLKKQPSLAGYCNWSNMSESDLVCLLSSTSDIKGDHKVWKQLDCNSWRKILIQNPTYVERCDLTMLESFDWQEVINAHPEFVKLCDVNKLRDDHVGQIIRFHPDLSYAFKRYSAKKIFSVLINFLAARWPTAMEVSSDSYLPLLSRMLSLIGFLAKSVFRLGIVVGYTFGLYNYFIAHETSVPGLAILGMPALLCVVAECSLFNCLSEKRANRTFIAFALIELVVLMVVGVPASGKAVALIMLGIISMWLLAIFVAQENDILDFAGSAFVYFIVGGGIGWLGSPCAYASMFNAFVGGVSRMVLAIILVWWFYRKKSWHRQGRCYVYPKWNLTVKYCLPIGVACCMRIVLTRWDLWSFVAKMVD